jgi:tRNA pseudouridine38-40 synthase
MDMIHSIAPRRARDMIRIKRRVRLQVHRPLHDPAMPRFALWLEYDGTNFAGTQVQVNQRTLYGVLDETLAGLNGGDAMPRLSSRLDQGVSAEQLVADCLLAKDWSPGSLCLALTHRFPPDIAVRAAARMPDDWSVVRCGTGKTYRYRIVIRAMRAVLEPHVCGLRRIDHTERFAACAALLPGRHDLSGFACLRGDGSDDGDPVRTITSAAWTHEPDAPLGNTWTFRITGEGFLYKQIRGMVGAMMWVAMGKASVEDFRAVVAGGRGAARLGNLAPPEGLMLERAHFTPEPQWVHPV